MIVVNLWEEELTARLLDSLLDQTFRDFEVILVDNASRGRLLSGLLRRFQHLRALPLTQNQGFSGGLYQGWTATKGEWILILNNDGYVDPEFIEKLANWRRNLSMGAVTAAVSNAGELPSNDALNLLLYNIKDAFGELPIALYPGGSACLIRKSLIPLDGFPKEHFAYYEDLFLGLMIRLTGWDIVKDSAALFHHIGSVTAKRLPDYRIRFYQKRNRLATIIALYTVPDLIKLTPLFILDFLYQILLFLRGTGEIISGFWLLATLPDLVTRGLRMRSTLSSIGRFSSKQSAAIPDETNNLHQQSEEAAVEPDKDRSRALTVGNRTILTSLLSSKLFPTSHPEGKPSAALDRFKSILNSLILIYCRLVRLRVFESLSEQEKQSLLPQDERVG